MWYTIGMATEHEPAGVSFRHVEKVYAAGQPPAVDDFTLDVRPGEFLVLVGPSGCGKSTTLRMVAGLELPTGGTVSIGGRDVTYLPPKDRDIAMVFQNYALYPHMTVRENMGFALRLRHVPKDEIARRVAAAAGTLGLVPYLDRLPKALSGGQRQRVALGRAIVREPAVFLFDEPLSNLDAKMRAEIVRLHQRLGATMIYVTHDQVEAMTMGERIVVMSGGRIQQAAAPLEVYHRPANRFVASFIGTPPMNLVPPGILDLGRTVGVRPEAVRVERMEAGGDAGKGGLSATVDLVEPLGAETIVHAVLDQRNVPMIARVAGDAAWRHGERVRLVPDLAKAVYFEN